MIDAMTQRASNDNAQAGNAIWFILLAVALMAALTIAITRTSDTVDQAGDTERGRVQASDLMKFTKGLEATIKQMMLRGISENDLCFHDVSWGHNDYNGASCADTANRLFHVEGGGLEFKRFANVTGWEVSGGNAVLDVGTAALDLVIEAEIPAALCREIDGLLGIALAGGDAPVDDVDARPRFAGTYAIGGGATDTVVGDDAAAFAGKTAGCRKSSSGDYYFYQVLLER